MALQHPGTVTFIDGDSERVVHVAQAADVPPAGLFAETASGWKPVVTVVARASGEHRFVREYGEAGELLRTTTLLVPA